MELNSGQSFVAVHTRLRAAILSGEIPEGATTSQAMLAERFGVGRTPLREALRMLQREGLVISQPNHRVRIAELSSEDAEELYIMRIALEAVPEAAGTVVVLNGDVPLLRAATVASLIAAHEAASRAATVLAAAVDDPSGLGRIVRDAAGGLARIVEERDASPEERAIREINAGIYVFDAAALRAALGKLSTDNEQGEEYLTDVFGLLVEVGSPVGVFVAPDADETLGANDRAQLAGLRALLRDRVNTAWMRSGVSILDPATAWIDVTATLEPDAVIDQNTQVRGVSSVAANA